MEILLPKGWPRPSGYSNGIVADGKFVFIAGQIGWDKNQKFKSTKMSEQFEQVLVNTLSILEEAGGKPDHIVRMCWFVTSRQEYLDSGAEIGRIYREKMGTHYPAMSVVEVSALIEEKAVLEIETTAVLPS